MPFTCNYNSSAILSLKSLYFNTFHLLLFQNILHLILTPEPLESEQCSLTWITYTQQSSLTLYKDTYFTVILPHLRKYLVRTCILPFQFRFKVECSLELPCSWVTLRNKLTDLQIQILNPGFLLVAAQLLLTKYQAKPFLDHIHLCKL